VGVKTCKVSGKIDEIDHYRPKIIMTPKNLADFKSPSMETNLHIQFCSGNTPLQKVPAYGTDPENNCFYVPALST